MLPSPSELKYFLEISSTLNISRAAERLGVTQPTLSLVIQRMEATFGTPLLLRNKSGVTLTKAGQRFVGQARNLLNEWEKVREETLRDQAEIRGRYTLGCHPSVALYSLPKFLGELLTENEGLEIKLIHDLSRKITEGVISYEIDFGIVVNPVSHPDLVLRDLYLDQMTFWVHPSRAHLTTLICDPNLLQTDHLLKEVQKSGFKFSRILPSTSLELIAALVAAGAGVGILPARVAQKEPSSRIERLSAKLPVYKDRICLIYRQETLQSKASKAIVAAACSKLKDRSLTVNS